LPFPAPVAGRVPTWAGLFGFGCGFGCG